MPKKVPYLREEQIERDSAALLAEYAQVRNPVQRGHRFRGKADSNPVIADSR